MQQGYPNSTLAMAISMIFIGSDVCHLPCLLSNDFRLNMYSRHLGCVSAHDAASCWPLGHTGQVEISDVVSAMRAVVDLT